MDSETVSPSEGRPVTLTFKWKRGLGRPETIAVLYAVGVGYCTADRLSAALPQLAPHRLESALTDLVAAQLVEIGPDHELTLSPDALFLDQLTQRPLVVNLPPFRQEPSDLGLTFDEYTRIGVIQPGLAVNALRVTVDR